MEKTYRVTGELPVYGHKTGETFSHDFTPEGERVHLEAGTLTLADPPEPALRQKPKVRKTPAVPALSPRPFTSRVTHRSLNPAVTPGKKEVPTDD